MKNIKITLEDVFALPTAEIINPDNFKPVSHVSTDTRSIKKNSLFVALKGKNFDGHNFIVNAVKNGASAVVVNKAMVAKLKDINVPVISVKNTTAALGNIAAIWRKKFEGKVIALTGSNGKTSTKEILSVLLSAKFKVQKTAANNNNHIGVPLTILSADNKYNVLVLELGTNHFGEIPYTAPIAKPDYAVITNIGESHLEFFKNTEGVYNEKAPVYEAALSNNGKIFINTDDKIISKNTKKLTSKITYGFNNSADVKAVIKGKNDEGCTVIEITAQKTKFEVVLPLYGLNNAANYLSAVAIALELGLTKTEIVAATAKLKAVSKRLEVSKIKNLMLVDDTYNANPLSMKGAINLLADIKKYENKIAILGDMFELGEKSAELHASLAADIKKNKISAVYTIGKLMKNLDEKLEKTKISHKHFPNRKALGSFIEKLDLENSVVLVKGSRGMKMEEFVEVIRKRFIK